MKNLFRKFCSLVIAAVVAAVFVMSEAITDADTVSADAVSDMDEIAGSYSRFCAIQVYSMDGENLYSRNIDSEVFCASVIKLPYAVFVCRELSSGVRSLDETFTYTSSWYHGGSGIIKNGGYGVKYTISQLLDYMLRYSDNVAYDVLVHLFGTEGFNAMVNEWGYNVKLGTPSPRWPNVTSSFMRVSMEQMALHSGDGEAWAVAWNALNNSTDVISRSVLGNDSTAVAIKYGEVEYVYHEVCYIDSENPYIFIIMTGISGYNYDTAFIKKAAACADRIAGEYNENKPLRGDADNNGQVTLEDLVLLWKYLKSEDITFEKPANADVSGDGNINILDYVILSRWFVEV